MAKKSVITRSRGGLAAAALLFAAAAAQAAPTYLFDGSTTSSIPGLTGFSTTGAMMSGMTVEVTFTSGATASALWGTTGAVSGAATGTNWSLSQSGDTFVGIDQTPTGLWNFQNTTGLAVQSLTLSGNTGFTVFDVDTYGDTTCDTAPGAAEGSCTDGSARGSRFRLTDGALDPVVTYSDKVGITPAGPLGDLYHVVNVNFGANGIAGNFAFDQDTDNDSRFGTVPEPGSLALVAVAVAGLGAARRRAVR